MEIFFLTLFSLLIIVLLFLPDGACTLYTGTLCARCLPQRKERRNRVRSQVMTGCWSCAKMRADTTNVCDVCARGLSVVFSTTSDDAIPRWPKRYPQRWLPSLDELDSSNVNRIFSCFEIACTVKLSADWNETETKLFRSCFVLVQFHFYVRTI